MDTFIFIILLNIMIQLFSSASPYSLTILSVRAAVAQKAPILQALSLLTVKGILSTRVQTYITLAVTKNIHSSRVQVLSLYAAFNIFWIHLFKQVFY